MFFVFFCFGLGGKELGRDGKALDFFSGGLAWHQCWNQVLFGYGLAEVVGPELHERIFLE